MTKVTDARLNRILGIRKHDPAVEPQAGPPPDANFTPNSHEDDGGLRRTPYSWPADQAERDADGYRAGEGTVGRGRRSNRTVGHFMRGHTRMGALDE